MSGGDGSVTIQDANGRDINFYPDGQGGYLSINGAISTLVPQMDGSFRWIEGDGKTYTFDADGFLTQILRNHLVRDGNGVEKILQGVKVVGGTILVQAKACILT